MRGLSATALRALRSVRTPRLAAEGRLRPFCVASTTVDSKPESATIDRPLAPPVDLTSTENEGVVPLSSTAAVNVDAMPADAVSETAPASAESDVTSSDVDEQPVTVAAVADDAAGEEASVAQTETDTDTEELGIGVDNLDIVDDTLRQVPGKNIDLEQYATPEDFFAELQVEVESRFVRCMLLFRHALEQEGSPLVSKEAIDLMLPVMARHGWYRTVKETLGVAEEKGIELDTVMYNCALFAMTRTGELDLMKEVVAKMLAKNKARPNATSYNLLIAAIFYRGSVDDAFKVLDEMKSNGVASTLATYQTLISGCMRRREHDRAVETLHAAEGLGMSISAMTVAQLLFFAAQRDKHHVVDQLITKVEDLLPIYRTEISRISARRSSYLRKDAHYQEDIRGVPRLELSLIQAILQSACRGARPDLACRAWTLHREMYPELEPTEDMWLSLITSLAAAGDFQAAFDGVAHMRAAGFTPTLKDLNQNMVKPLSRDINKIDDLYYYLSERLDGDDVEAAATDENDVEGGAEQVGDESTNAAELASEDQMTQEDGSTSTAEDVAAPLEMKDVNDDADEPAGYVSLSDAIGLGTGGSGMDQYELPWAMLPRAELAMTEFNVIISACSHAGDIDRAFQTYDEACGRLGLTRNEDTLNALLEGCIQTGHIRGGTRVMDEARSDGTLYTPETIHMVTRLYSRSARYVDAYDFIREADDGEYTIYARTLQMLGRQLKKGGMENEYDDVVAMGVRMGYRDTAIRSSERGAQRQRWRREPEREREMSFGAGADEIPSSDEAQVAFDTEQSLQQQKMDS